MSPPHEGGTLVTVSVCLSVCLSVCSCPLLRSGTLYELQNSHKM